MGPLILSLNRHRLDRIQSVRCTDALPDSIKVFDLNRATAVFALIVAQ